MLEAATEALQKHWGYPSFRPGQADVVADVLAGRDVLAILPTGGGKSICYQVPALLGEGFTLVISPLVALMQDQVAGLSARGIPAAFINSTLSYREIDQRWTDAEFGRYRLLYVAPERLESEMFIQRASRLRTGLLAVDEAHCISEWGHAFRPSYLRIPEAYDMLGRPPVVALTATATPEVRRDIVEQLSLREPVVHVHGFDRPNIVWSVFGTENKPAQVRRVLAGVRGSGIIYSATRRGAERWAKALTTWGEPTPAYHGGLSARTRAEVQEQWLRGDHRVLSATNAFGMGVDKPDVRFVIHAELPTSLEAYYQEAGRAGRDGARAYAVLLAQPGDSALPRTLIEDAHPSARDVRAVYDAVCSLGQVAIGAQPEGPLAVRMDALQKVTALSRGRVRAAIDVLTDAGVFQSHLLPRHHVLLRFRQPGDRIRAYAHSQPSKQLRLFVEGVLRAVHADAFAAPYPIDLRLLHRRTGLPSERILQGLSFLAERDLVEVAPTGSAVRLSLTAPRTSAIPIDDAPLRAARRRAEVRLGALEGYVRSVGCRRRYLLTYFGEASPERCGRCDVCMGRHRPPDVTPSDEPHLRDLLKRVEAGLPDDGFDLASTKQQALTRWLVQEGYLTVTDPLAPAFALTEKARALV